jgi:hypothetical protein
MPANFKTYEAQSRLLAAVVATLPDKYKFDFKGEIPLAFEMLCVCAHHRVREREREK